MSEETQILVLGAYGLAGRAIVRRLLEKTTYSVIAGGRNEAKLRLLKGERVTTCLLDVDDTSAVTSACEKASFVINAVGPFAKNGFNVAKTVLETGKPYLDCANEQRHYQNLIKLDELAQKRNLPLVTGAGVFPGLSTLLVAHMLERYPDTIEVDCCCVQFRHAYMDSGLASVMGAILEAVEQPVSVKQGMLVPTRLGKSVRIFDLPPPFGQRLLLEVPLIDAFTLRKLFPVREYHTWFYVGDLPVWLLKLFRILQPQHRPRVYRLVESIVRRINNRETAKAISAGVSPECMIYVRVVIGDQIEERFVTFYDGAIATACLPVYIADGYIRGNITKTGLLTPLDIITTDRLKEIVDGAITSMKLG
ncbi:MAG: saccharopine dehydrogenase NADP-binding domain-containing protein [Candidatus Hydrogenedentes bacterium]|nr:saccharopine dehydrogenase NADP-binding domain-containing protein [Candidatus Hydrogenedentota bacterium]